MLRCGVALAVIRVQERRVIFAEPVGCCDVRIEVVVVGSCCVDVVQAKRVQPVPGDAVHRDDDCCRAPVAQNCFAPCPVFCFQSSRGRDLHPPPRFFLTGEHRITEQVEHTHHAISSKPRCA